VQKAYNESREYNVEVCVPDQPMADDAEILGQMISTLKRLSADERTRIYRTIGTFFQAGGVTFDRALHAD
jgi:hypothetical protein